MNPARVSDKSHLIEELENCEGGMVNNGCFGKIGYCPVAAELDNRTLLAEQAQRVADSVLEPENTSDLVESVQEICEVRGGIPRQLTNLAIEKNLGQGVPRLTEEQAFSMLGMHIVKDPGFSYDNPEVTYQV